MKKIIFIISIIVCMCSSCSTDEPKQKVITIDNVQTENAREKKYSINNLNGTAFDGAIFDFVYNYSYEWVDYYTKEELCGCFAVTNINDPMLVEQGHYIGYDGDLTKIHIYKWYILRETNNKLYLKMQLDLFPFIDKDNPNADSEHVYFWKRNKHNITFEIIDVNKGMNSGMLEKMTLKVTYSSTTFIEHEDFLPDIPVKDDILELTLTH